LGGSLEDRAGGDRQGDPYARNPQKPGAIAKVAASLKEFGWKQPIVVDGEMVVIAGHTRLEAARSLGLRKVPAPVARDLDPAKVKAYRIADDRVAQDAELDAELLQLELTDLKDLAYDLPILGFEDADLRVLRGKRDWPAYPAEVIVTLIKSEEGDAEPARQVSRERMAPIAPTASRCSSSSSETRRARSPSPRPPGARRWWHAQATRSFAILPIPRTPTASPAPLSSAPTKS
jgi:ParB-like chromosome segregation protein Spo0J